MDAQSILHDKFIVYEDVYRRLSLGDKETIKAVIDFIAITEDEQNNALRRGSKAKVDDNRIMLSFIDYLKEHILGAAVKLQSVQKTLTISEKRRSLKEMLRFKKPGETDMEVLEAMTFTPTT